MVQLVKRASDVRITEINLSSVITSASSSVACIPIISNQGSTKPLNFTNSNDFISQYGNANPAISNTIQSALNFFTEGNNLWAIRVVGAGSVVPAVLMYTDSTFDVTYLLGVGVADPLNTNIQSLAPSGTTAIALFYPNFGPGSYGDKYAIQITSSGLPQVTNVVGTGSGLGGVLSNGTYEYQIAAIATIGEGLASAQVTVPVSGSSNTGSTTITWSPVVGAIGYEVYGRTTGGTYGLLTTVGGGTYTFTDTGVLTPNVTQQPINNPADVTTAPTFVVSVYDTSNPNQGSLEDWTCTLGLNVDASGVQTELENRINPFSQYIQCVSVASSLVSTPVISSVGPTNMAGGNSGAAPTSSDVVNAMQVFKNKNLYPTNLFINGGIADPVTQLAMDTLVQNRGDAVSLIDVPSISQKSQAAIDYRNLALNLNSTYSALFCPDVLQADLVNGQQVYIPFSGWAAALCARTDRVANAAYSPAGLNRGLVNVLKARYSYDDGQATNLYDAQVNYVRTFVGQGIALWEQQTLSGQSSALSWLSVRRIVNVMKVSLYNFLLYSLQEMNTDSLRRQIVNSCSSYLDTIQAAEGIYGYSVECDNGNNTPATANAGVLVLTIVIVPNIPVHEIQLQMVISKQGVSFSEVLSKVNNG